MLLYVLTRTAEIFRLCMSVHPCCVCTSGKFGMTREVYGKADMYGFRRAFQLEFPARAYGQSINRAAVRKDLHGAAGKMSKSAERIRSLAAVVQCRVKEKGIIKVVAVKKDSSRSTKTPAVRRTRNQT